MRDSDACNHICHTWRAEITEVMWSVCMDTLAEGVSPSMLVEQRLLFNHLLD